ncbi:MAG: DUF1800 domain-containing protein [Phycisphaerales bacterium]|nr:DUF1800 domain-containing protein [Phycisphaerales bacterium]
MSILQAPKHYSLIPPPEMKPTGGRIPISLVGMINRTSFGFTQAEHHRALAMGHAAYLNEQLNHETIDDSTLNTRLAGAEFPTLAMTPELLSAVNTSDVQNQIIRSRLIRAVFSRRQLFERMVDFWSDHFNIWLFEDGIAGNQKTWDDSTVIRPHALGYFPAMLSASAHSPTMLDYLNNNTNTATGPNQNYARELMELHSLGVDGGYTQDDVIQVARCFTGWTYWGGSTNPSSIRYTFRFNAGNHDNGQKIVLGNIIPAGGGQQDGETVLQILAAHPSTANYIAKKMLRHFWGENPSADHIASIAAIYTRTQGDIRAMMRAVLNTPFNQPWEAKLKRPFHHMASALRALSATVTTPGNLQTQMTSSGHLPFNWQTPDGYPDTIAAWSGLLLPRWNFGASLMNSSFSGVSVDATVTGLLAGLPAPLTAVAIVGRINNLMFGGTMPANEQIALTTYLLPNAPTSAKIREAFGLAVGSPAFQWA